KVPMRRLIFALLILVASAACYSSTKPPATPVPPGEADLAAAAQQIAADLAKQLGAGSSSRTLVIDPMLDKQTGQQTAASVRVEDAVRPAITTTLKGVTVLPFNTDGAGKSRFVVTGNVAAGTGPDQYLLSVAMTDRESGLVVAQSAARFHQK